ncbi:MAG: SPOR domain-containing protein [Sphaerochaetaceae bacterium]|nr:SPOR domain-containing protein [Sphaerochaetaceae bacterium]
MRYETYYTSFYFSNHHATTTSSKATHIKKLPQFDFYTVLKNDHKQTHESHSESNKPQIKAKSTLNQAPVISKSQPEVRKPKPIYFLQAAAVRHHNDADQLKAQLILAGYDVQVKKISKNNTIWYRVLVGPYTSKKQAENVKEKLLNHHVNAHLISRGSTEG